MLAIIVTSFSQQTDVTASALTKTDYLKKSKSQKSGAWLLLGGGTTVLVIAAVSTAGVDFTNKKKFPIVPVCIGDDGG